MFQWRLNAPATTTPPDTDTDSEPDMFVSPYLEESRPLLPETSPNTGDKASLIVPRIGSSYRRLRRSSSEQNLRQLHDRDRDASWSSPVRDSTESTVIPAPSHREASSAQLLARLELRRTASNSRVETISQNRAPTFEPEILHRRLTIEASQASPSKSCLKPPKSNATTPPSAGHSTTPLQTGHVRRVKTVDFDELASETAASPSLLEIWGGKSTIDGSASRHEMRAASANNPRGRSRTPPSASSCPGPRIKSSPADTAITRADVHVVAIAPTVAGGDSAAGFPATPTMQMVESKAGRYEVVWDDIPPDQEEPPRNRRSSSASQSLHGSGWSSDVSLSPFRPQVVVFPDDDGRVPQYECAVADDEDHMVIVPPTGPSIEDDEAKESPQDAQLLAPADPFVNYSRPRIHQSGSKGPKHPPTDRRLSNMEDSEVRFRGHRDSVAMAKKRMHARHDAISSSRDFNWPDANAKRPSAPRSGLNTVRSAGGPVAETSRMARNSSSESNFNEQHKHIRIVENR